MERFIGLRMGFVGLVWLTLGWSLSAYAAPGDITTVAGGFFPEGGPASDAKLNDPQSVFVDGAGNIFVADTRSHQIRKVDPSGIISTVAGRGATGAFGDFSGDGGPATEAELDQPAGVAVDGSGNIYIVDRNNNRIRKVDPSGTISTVAGGGGTSSFGGFSGDGGPATGSEMDDPQGVFVDVAGQIYIADTDNHRIRKVDTAGTITTVAGSGEEDFSGDGGPAVEAALNAPTSVFSDGAGQIYIADIADKGNHRIRKVDRAGTITTVAGNGERAFPVMRVRPPGQA